MAFSLSPLATPRSISSRLAVVALVATLVIAGWGPARATSTDDRASIERGRTAGREMMMLRDPRVFGMALLHARSLMDVDAFLAGRGDGDFAGVPEIGPSPATGLLVFVKYGDVRGFDIALRRDDLVATSAMWDADPRAAALYDAGVEDVVLAAAGGNPAQERLSINPVIDLARHVARIPDGALGVDLAPIRRGVASAPDGTHPSGTAFARALAAAVDAAAPPSPIGPARYADGPAGDAVFGVAGATVAELLDSPLWLMQADAQRFIDGYAAHLIALAPASGARMGKLRVMLRGGLAFARSTAAHDEALQEHTALVGAVVQTDKSRAMPVVLGSLAAQLVYNAAMLRDASASAAWLRMLATTPALDASVPGWADARHGASAIAPADWNAQFGFGLRLVDLIMKGGSR